VNVVHRWTEADRETIRERARAEVERSRLLRRRAEEARAVFAAIQWRYAAPRHRRSAIEELVG
jgi:hypothetical protein